MKQLIFALLLTHSLAFAELPTPATHVVYIGDSLSLGTFGETIETWLRNSPNTSFTFIVSGGSAPAQWMNDAFDTGCGYYSQSRNLISPQRGKCLKGFHTPTLKSLLKNTDGEKIAIIELGTNFGYGGSKNYHLSDKEEYIRNKTDAIKLIETANTAGYLCIWIGPPNIPRYQGARLERDYQIIREAIVDARTIKPCKLIDSREISSYPLTVDPSVHMDGIHYDFPGPVTPEGLSASREWAESVIRLLLF